MPPLASLCHSALRSRDRRFDGVFFTGVTSTGIYCRPICPTRTPLLANCVFFDDSIAALRAGFRPCLRCRPELSPARSRGADESVPAQLLRCLRIRAVEGAGVPAIARAAGYSERQFRRLLVEAYGVSPVEVLQWGRLLFAKRLLQDTNLPVSQIALSAGFRSVRRFNACFRDRLHLTPDRLRKRAPREHSIDNTGASLRMTLAYRPPYAWTEMCRWLRARATRGVEFVGPGESYARTCRWGGHSGWLVVRNDAPRSQLTVEISPSLAPALAVVETRLRSLLDLDAQPAVLVEAFAGDPCLGPLVDRHPGLRLPGSWEIFETAVRTVLGQQVSVAAATTLAGRLVQRFGERCSTPQAELTHLSLTPETLGNATVEALCAEGLTRRRAETLRVLAAFAQRGGLNFSPGEGYDAVCRTLQELPGIGPWTAQYITLRALRFPDAFPAGDLGLRRALGRGEIARESEVEKQSARWRPWRAYAAALLWQSQSDHLASQPFNS